MKAELTLANCYNNKSLMNFFFRSQAVKTLEELLNEVEEDINQISNKADEYTDDLDELEELLYNESIEDIIGILNLSKK